MNIPLNDGYRLSADKYQWIVQKKHTRLRDGEASEEWESLSYHRTPEQAINHHAGVLIRTADTETLTDALATIEIITAGLCKALQPHIKVEKQ